MRDEDGKEDSEEKTSDRQYEIDDLVQEGDQESKKKSSCHQITSRSISMIQMIQFYFKESCRNTRLGITLHSLTDGFRLLRRLSSTIKEDVMQ